jgi:Calcineurin-like phosphoesterase/Purple acid Phosphatase, N-terminal domain
MLKIYLILSIIITTWSIPGFALPRQFRISLGDQPETQISVSWNSDSTEDNLLIYGTDPGNLSQSHDNIVPIILPDPLNYVFQSRLTALTPDTLYYYKAGNSQDGFSPLYSFKTAPLGDLNCGEFSFVVVGDSRPDRTLGGGFVWGEISAEVKAKNPDFVINGGDLVVDGEDLDGWDDFLSDSEDLTATIPLMVTIGNHDTGPGTGDEAYFNSLFDFPRSSGTFGSGTEDYYFFTYGNAIFVQLSTESFKDGDIPFENQAKWLDEVLTNNPKKWKFVSLHKPIYCHESIMSHEPNEENQNGALVPIIDKHHVDIVFQSHVHWYERYKPSACSFFGSSASDHPCEVAGFEEGTVYVVSGGAGAFTVPESFCGSEDSRVLCEDKHHYIKIDIHGETLTYEAYGAFPSSDSIFDSFTITKNFVDCENIDPHPEDGGIDSGDDGDIMEDTAEDTTEDSDPSTDVTNNIDSGDNIDSDQKSSGCSCKTTSQNRPDLLMFIIIMMALYTIKRRLMNLN